MPARVAANLDQSDLDAQSVESSELRQSHLKDLHLRRAVHAFVRFKQRKIMNCFFNWKYGARNPRQPST